MPTTKTAAVLLLGAALCFSHAVHADEVVLKNGDRITGELIRLDDGKLAIKTPYAGKVTIGWDQVDTFSTDQPVWMTIDGSNRVKATVLSSGSGTVALSSDDWLDTEPIPVSRFTGMTREPEPTVKVSGRVNVGASMTSGNTQTEKLNASAEMVARSVQNRFTIGGAANKAKDRGQETESNWLGYLKYDHFLSKRWYAYANGTGEHDKFKDINLRTTFGAGTGYQFIESKRTSLSAEIGVNYVNTDFDLGQDDDYPAGRWALDFDHKLFDTEAQFFHHHEVYASLEDVKKSFVRTRTGLRLPVVERLNATIQYNYDWENQPAPGRSRSDRTLLVSLGYSW